MGPSGARRADDDIPASVEPESTELRILEGALRTLGRHGSSQLRMNAVSAAAGVARGTLYRYYPTKTDLFAALVDYERRRFAEALRHAVDADRSRPPMDVLLDFVLEYLHEHPALERLLQDEPEFVLRYLRRHLSFLRLTAARLIEPSFVAGKPVDVDEAEVAEVVLRVLIANFLVPPEDPSAVNRALKALLAPITT
jgi:AcrR family transcriptional regulator